MRRRAAVARKALAFSVAVAVSLPGTVEAKAFQLNRVIIQGPGLSNPVVLSRDQLGIPRGGGDPAALAAEGVMGGYRRSDMPPGGDLGPRYRLVWELELLSGEVAALRQDFYPFADAGPHTFTPWGQRVVFDIGTPATVHEVPRGWLAFPEELIPRLQRYGLPADRSGPPAGLRLPGPWFLAAVLAGLLSVSLVLLARGRWGVHLKLTHIGDTKASRA